MFHERKHISAVKFTSAFDYFRYDLRAFRWVQTMIFAIKEINENVSLLPGVTLGYRIMDSCDQVHTGLTGGLSLASGSLAYHQNQTEGSQCVADAPVSAVIGLASSTPTRALAHTLGPFGIPVVWKRIKRLNQLFILFE